MEMEQGGQRIVRIVDNSNNVEWILYPDQQSYVEHRLPQTATAGAGQADDANPCAAMPDANCENLGTETVSGRQAVKWKMTFSHQGKVYASTEWIDKERHMPLRSERADGSRSEMVFLGQDQLGGRPAEKWEMKSSQSGKAPESSYQWYDPQLDLAIREEFPGGFVRELVNIREGQQPESLFSVPAGFKQISIPGKGK